MVPENIHPYQRGGGGAVLKAKIFKGMYEPKLEFPEWGGGCSDQKKPSVGGVWILSGATHYMYL